MLTRAKCDMLFRYLPAGLMRCVARLDDEAAFTVSEARLRAQGPFSLCGGGRSYFFGPDGAPISEPGDGAVICTQEEVDECVDKLCSYSRYSVDSAMRNGFIPLPDGSRAGICGNAVIRDGNVSFMPVTSVNIRLRRFVPGFAYGLAARYAADGIASTLVISPPMYGKTTFLASLALLLGKRGVKVAVADERAEIRTNLFSCGSIDVITGCPKSQAIELLTRTMSPSVIICDEISYTESQAVMQTQSAGVALVASLHADSVAGALRRPFAREMIDAGVFRYAVVIRENYEYDITELG